LVVKEIIEKKCSKCKKIKNIDNFYIRRDSKKFNARVSHCIKCMSIYNKKYTEPRRLAESNKEVVSMHRAGNAIKKAKIRAKKKKLNFNINKKYLYELFIKQGGRCYFSNIKMERSCKLNIFSPSLDRLNPNKGYVKGNVAWTLLGVNSFKQNLPETEFLELVSRIKWKKMT